MVLYRLFSYQSCDIATYLLKSLNNLFKSFSCLVGELESKKSSLVLKFIFLIYSIIRSRVNVIIGKRNLQVFERGSLLFLILSLFFTSFSLFPSWMIHSKTIWISYPPSWLTEGVLSPNQYRCLHGIVVAQWEVLELGRANEGCMCGRGAQHRVFELEQYMEDVQCASWW